MTNSSNSFVKSSPSSEIAHVRFANYTPRIVDVLWMNFKGHEVKYVTLPSHQCYDVTTYTGHPWMFRDHVWKNVKYHANKQDIFYPQQTVSSNNRPIRKLVCIFSEGMS